MAEPQVTLRIPRALLTLIDDDGARSNRSRSNVIVDTLADRFLGEDAPPAPRAKATPKAPGKPAAVITGAQLRERDLAPRLGEADSQGDGRGAGMVAGLSLPVGNTRAPMQKGAGKAKR